MAERLPTADDFERILSGIVPASISPDAQASMEAGIKEYVRQDLEDQEMTEEDMEQLMLGIGSFFQSSLVPVGEAVGPLAALSTGEPATQMQLSAHRVVGTASKTTNEGIPRFQELLRATLQQKAISSSIHFWERQTLSSVRKLAALFVYRTLADFLELDGAAVGKMEDEPDWNEEWHEDYRILNNYRDATPAYVLRLRLNREEILRYGLTPDMVAEKLKATYPEPVYVYSSTDVAIIDVYAKKPAVSEAAPYITEENALSFYLRDILLPSLKEVHMTGIAKITAAFPRQQELTSFITSWNAKGVTVDVQKAELQGVHLDDLIHLLAAAGYEPQAEMEGNRIILGVRGGGLAELGEKILADQNLRNLNGTWYLETNGSNLAEVLSMDIVNNEVSFCTDVTEICVVFGIQAARDYLLEQFISILSSDSHMDPRHLILLADVMTNVGLLAPATSTGVSRQKIGPLTRAAFERPVEHFLLAASFGETEKIRGVSASVFAGKLANIGPEAFMKPKILESVDEGQDEELVDDEKEPMTIEIPEQLTLEEAVVPAARPAVVALPRKVSMYARTGTSASAPPPPRTGTSTSAPPPRTVTGTGTSISAPPRPPPTIIELPDVLTLEPATAVVRPVGLPARRIGITPPARRQPVEVPATLTLEPADESAIPDPTPTPTTGSKPLPRRRF